MSQMIGVQTSHIYHIFFIHLADNGHLGYLAIMGITAVNIGVKASTMY